MVTWPFVSSLLKLKPLTSLNVVFVRLVSTKNFFGCTSQTHIAYRVAMATGFHWWYGWIFQILWSANHFFCRLDQTSAGFLSSTVEGVEKTVIHQHWPPTNPLEPSSKTLLTFHCTDWFKGILTMAYHKPQIIGAQNPLSNITHIYRCTGSCQNTVTVEYEG